MTCQSCDTGAHPATPLFARDSWKQHPRYPSQLLLLGSHDNFRRISKHLLDQAVAHVDDDQEDEDDDWRIDFRLLFNAWQGAMRSHEGYEEHKLYPYLARRYSVLFSALVDDHQRLHALELEVRRALKEEPVAAVVDAYRNYDAELVAHLAREEDIVIPMLLEMSADEFLRYTHLPLPMLMRDITAQCASC